MSYAQQAINSLDQTINSFKSRVDVKVSDVSTSTANIQATTNRIYENIERFKNDLMHGEESQIAHENILRIDQIIKEQFSNHIAIRRTVMGVVRDFDINLVRNSTIQELSEELWITSSRYWLSYALIAITAWVNNYPEVARNALAESGRKDAIKTTLFFCLMNLRFGRMDAAKKWFYEYFKTLDPTMLQQETAILLQSFLNGIFGKDKELEQEVISLIDEWISIINDNEQISTELLNAYETYINNLSAPVQFSYESILQFCVNSSELENSYKDVSKFELLLQFVKGLDVDAAPQDDTNYKSRIDAILMNLISNYDAEELELKKQQEYYRCIVENNGDIPQAEAQFQAMEELENTQFNIGKQMLKWAIYDDNDQTNIQVRKFGFQNTKAWFKSAVDRFDAKLQEAFPSEYRVCTAAINLGHLLWGEKLFLLNQSGADGKVLFGSCIVLHEIVTMTYACVPIGPIPCDKVDSVFALDSGQHSAVEIGQHLVAILQAVGFQRGRRLELPHIFRCGLDDLIYLVLGGDPFWLVNILIAVGNAAGLSYLTQRRTVKLDTQPVSVNFVRLETLLSKDNCCFSEVASLRIFTVVVHSYFPSVVDKIKKRPSSY